MEKTMQKVIDKIIEFEKRGVKNIRLIALVSETSSEVIFYGIVDGVQYQSNSMVEEGKIDPGEIDEFYNSIVERIRADKNFTSGKMNIIKADSDSCQVEYEEKRCKTFKIIKDWEKQL